MTDTSTTTGTIEHVDPTTVVVEANVRTTAPLDKEFLASIRENGVLTPILARRDQNGNIIVRAGQRRTLAAREVGLTSIPAFVVEASEAIADRIIQQLVENEHRTALTDGDRVAAFQQLAFEGLTPQVIAKRTATKQADVKQGLKVAESQFATAAVVEHQLTFDQAATLIEFEGDDERVADLIEVATSQPEQFAHAAQRARDDEACHPHRSRPPVCCSRQLNSCASPRGGLALRSKRFSEALRQLRRSRYGQDRRGRPRRGCLDQHGLVPG